ncbi:MAG: hypothetical protein R2726_00485 [Acidimicrobiales bacterium]
MDDERGSTPIDGDDIFDDLFDDDLVIERAVLNDSDDGRRIQAAFVVHFGAFVQDQLRPRLREVAATGGQPQLLVNGLADLLRSVADRIEFPLDHPRSGFPPDLDRTAP